MFGQKDLISKKVVNSCKTLYTRNKITLHSVCIVYGKAPHYILCLISRTTVTSLRASNDKRCKTHYLCVNPGIPFWTLEKTRVITSVLLCITRWRHSRSRGETKYSCIISLLIKALQSSISLFISPVIIIINFAELCIWCQSWGDTAPILPVAACQMYTRPTWFTHKGSKYYPALGNDKENLGRFDHREPFFFQVWNNYITEVLHSGVVWICCFATSSCMFKKPKNCQ